MKIKEGEKVDMKMSISEILEFKKKQIIAKYARERSHNYHILLDGEYYKSFIDNSARRRYIMNSKRFFRDACDKEVRVIYDKTLYEKYNKPKITSNTIE